MQRRSRLKVILGTIIWACGAASAAAQAQFVGSHTWKEPDPLFGGFSGIDLTADGSGAIIVSDRGRIATARLDRTEGRITGVSQFTIRKLKGALTEQMPRGYGDSEGIAVADDGIYISFEGAEQARVWRYEDVSAQGFSLPRHPDFGAMQRNSSLEALAVDEAGTLYTLPERSGAADRPFPVYRFLDGRWDQPFTIPREGDFLPVGADFGPDGMLYLLERNFVLFAFETRIRRFRIAGDTIEGGETVLQTRLGRHDNLEGLAVWRDGQGRIRLTMISDNNFRAFQVTEFVEYALPQ